MTRWFARGLAVAAVVWCGGLGVWLWITPIRSEGVGSTAYADSSGVMHQSSYRVADVRSFADVSLLGPLPLVVPAVIAAMAAWAVWSGRRVAATIATALLLGFTLLAGFSIGPVYMPAVGALLLALVALGGA